MNRLFNIKVWWKSRTLRFFGLFGALSAIDASFFNGDTGMFLLQAFLTGMNALPFVEMTAEQGISTLVFLISGIGVWLRNITTEPLENK
jgi:hypothetical protein